MLEEWSFKEIQMSGAKSRKTGKEKKRGYIRGAATLPHGHAQSKAEFYLRPCGHEVKSLKKPLQENKSCQLEPYKTT